MKEIIYRTLFSVSQKYEPRIVIGEPVKGDMTREIEREICQHIHNITPKQRLVVNQTAMLFASRLTGDMLDEYTASLGENMIDCYERINKVLE